MPILLTIGLLTKAVTTYGPALARNAILAVAAVNNYADDAARQADQKKFGAAVDTMKILQYYVGIDDLLDPSFFSAEGVPEQIKHAGLMGWFKPAKSTPPRSLYNPGWFPDIGSDLTNLHFYQTKDRLEVIPAHMSAIYDIRQRFFDICYETIQEKNGIKHYRPHAGLLDYAGYQSRRAAYVYLKIVDNLIRKIEEEKISFYEAQIIMAGLRESLNDSLAERRVPIFGGTTKESLRTGRVVSYRKVFLTMEEAPSMLHVMDEATETFKQKFASQNLSEIVQAIAKNMQKNRETLLLTVAERAGATFPKHISISAMKKDHFSDQNLGKIYTIFIKHYENNFSQISSVENLEKELIHENERNEKSVSFIEQLKNIYTLSKITTEIDNILLISRTMGTLTEGDLIPVYREFLELLVKKIESSQKTIKILKDASKANITEDRLKEISNILSEFDHTYMVAKHILEGSILKETDLSPKNTKDKLKEMNDAIGLVRHSIENNADISQEKRLELYAVLDQQALEAERRVGVSATKELKVISKEELIQRHINAGELHVAIKQNMASLKGILTLEQADFLQIINYVNDGFSAIYIDHCCEKFGKLKFSYEENVFSVNDTTGLDWDLFSLKTKEEKTQFISELKEKFIRLSKLYIEINLAASGLDGLSAENAIQLTEKLKKSSNEITSFIQLKLKDEYKNNLDNSEKFLSESIIRLNGYKKIEENIKNIDMPPVYSDENLEYKPVAIVEREEKTTDLLSLLDQYSLLILLSSGRNADFGCDDSSIVSPTVREISEGDFIGKKDYVKVTGGTLYRAYVRAKEGGFLEHSEIAKINFNDITGVADLKENNKIDFLRQRVVMFNTVASYRKELVRINGSIIANLDKLESYYGRLNHASSIEELNYLKNEIQISKNEQDKLNKNLKSIEEEIFKQLNISLIENDEIKRRMNDMGKILSSYYRTENKSFEERKLGINRKKEYSNEFDELLQKIELRISNLTRSAERKTRINNLTQADREVENFAEKQSEEARERLSSKLLSKVRESLGKINNLQEIAGKLASNAEDLKKIVEHLLKNISTFTNKMNDIIQDFRDKKTDEALAALVNLEKETRLFIDDQTKKLKLLTNQVTAQAKQVVEGMKEVAASVAKVEKDVETLQPIQVTSIFKDESSKIAMFKAFLTGVLPAYLKSDETIDDLKNKIDNLSDDEVEKRIKQIQEKISMKYFLSEGRLQLGSLFAKVDTFKIPLPNDMISLFDPKSRDAGKHGKYVTVKLSELDVARLSLIFYKENDEESFKNRIQKYENLLENEKNKQPTLSSQRRSVRDM